MELLAQEYLKILDIIAQYDGLIMTIKGWSITVGIAIIGYSLKQRRRSLVLLCCVSSLVFSFVDAKFKEYQVAYYPRMQTIEKCQSKKLNGDKCIPLQVDQSWNKNKHWYGVFLQYGKAGVLMPHIFLFFAAIYLYRKQNYFESPSELT